MTPSRITPTRHSLQSCRLRQCRSSLCISRGLLLLLMLFTAICPGTFATPHSKRVYITLDVSGSMNGNKYALANYTTQMIVSLCDEQDEVSIIVYGVEELLSKKSNPLKTIQEPINKIKFGSPQSTTSQFDDIMRFNRIYKPSEDKQDWLLIIGDGVWGTDSYNDDKETFQNIVQKGTLNVCYLQTGLKIEENNDFTQFASSLSVIDIIKSDTTPATIKKGCDHFARKILGFSEVPFNVKQTGDKCLTLQTQLPLKRFYIVYQDQVATESLPQIISATADGNALTAKQKGSPTTKPLRTRRNEITLSAHVWQVNPSSNSNPIITANSEVQVCFDKKIDTRNITIYPFVEDIEFSSIGISRLGSSLKTLDSRTFAICRDEKKATVHIELDEASAQQLPVALLEKTKVVVKANNKDYKAEYENGAFECDIDLIDDETLYYAECDCPGYFKRVTPIMKIVKGECEPEEPPVREIPPTDLGTITFDVLKRESIPLTIHDSLTKQVLDPELFDISFEVEANYLYEDPVWQIVDDSIIMLQVRPKGEWCECLFPESLNINMVSTPKEAAYKKYGKSYSKTVYPIRYHVLKERPWLSRCLWVIISLLVLILFCIYFRALMKKKRFKKNAMMTPRYYSYYGDLIDDQGGTKLRREGFGPWFARWFLPNDERTTLSFDKPLVSALTLIAAESKDVVNLLKSNCDWNTIEIPGYDPETDISKSKTVKLGDMGIIEVSAPDGSRDGELTFSSGSENDGAAYRIFLGLLMLAAIVAILILSVLIIKSL